MKTHTVIDSRKLHDIKILEVLLQDLEELLNRAIKDFDVLRHSGTHVLGENDLSVVMCIMKCIQGTEDRDEDLLGFARDEHIAV